MRRRRSLLSASGTRGRVAAFVGALLAAFFSTSLAFAGFGSSATGGPMSVTTKRIFPGPRIASAWDLRDASSGAESNKSDPFSYSDAVVSPSSTAIAGGTNRYLEFTFSSARAGGISVSSMQFNFRLASAGGAQAGNACFWFEVRSGGSVIGTHGSYAAAAGCSTGTTQTTFSTSIWRPLPERLRTSPLSPRTRPNRLTTRAERLRRCPGRPRPSTRRPTRTRTTGRARRRTRRGI